MCWRDINMMMLEMFWKQLGPLLSRMGWPMAAAAAWYGWRELVKMSRSLVWCWWVRHQTQTVRQYICWYDSYNTNNTNCSKLEVSIFSKQIIRRFHCRYF